MSLLTWFRGGIKDEDLAQEANEVEQSRQPLSKRGRRLGHSLNGTIRPPPSSIIARRKSRTEKTLPQVWRTKRPHCHLQIRLNALASSRPYQLVTRHPSSTNSFSRSALRTA
jgi:hypothetical protein